ncbi:hypothetical protein G7L40_20390 [Paenibacillus polymyxa]|uniref:Uncharacterized protein n=1 Tax=Paenibacillus polymyxa TaxID=1406 RepID=A0A378XZ08_PAEPO|nr:hypothetical protein [Paenibacillus polymyxa]MBE7896151.1 hypothetical protein [Paenibacillus polymyxa]MBG9765905.1 hypothetical protein [Paenibacillus polymyxa]MCC3256680.1 hypothetical protein [Paenibacillus polymyxa]QPK54828.1 hypothetical protein G7035_20435 [Paenibacillus polymyxa]QPK59919.1 hypothetical protein G7L40_20390 [Paenibacillus polymyxa]
MIIELKRLPDVTRHMVGERTNDPNMDIWWVNGCNEEGEDYYELYIDSHDNHHSFYYKYGWGEIKSLEEALEELE